MFTQKVEHSIENVNTHTKIMTCHKEKYSIKSDATMVQMLQVTQRDFERTVINILKNLAQKGRPHV